MISDDRYHKVKSPTLRKALNSSLTDKEWALCKVVVPEVRISRAHSLLLGALSLLTGVPKRAQFEAIIEELAKRNGLPQPPIPSIMGSARRLRPKINGNSIRTADAIAESWPALWKAIEGHLAVRVRAYNTLNPPEVPMIDKVAAMPRRKVAVEQVAPEDNDWQPEGEDDDPEESLLAALEGRD